MKRAWGFDVSHWDVQYKGGPIIDYGPLIKLQPSFVFVKVTDGATQTARHADHIAAVQEAGLVLGVYHWFWPNMPVQPQVENFAAIIDQYKPPIIIVDNEQVFKNWELSQQFKAGEISLEDAVIPPEQISAKGLEFMNLLKGRYPDKLLLNYTADWFVNTYCKPMGKWINKFPLWLAAYPYEKETRTVADWDEFERLREGLTEEVIQDRMPLNAKQWLFWQWGADKLLLPPPYPKGFHVDLNVYNGAPEDFHAKFGGKPGGEQVEKKEEEKDKDKEEPEGVGYICNTGQLNIRSRPEVIKETETGKFLFKGDAVQVYEIDVNNWGRIHPVESLWVNVKYLKKA